jgi:hypothetical protein
MLKPTVGVRGIQQQILAEIDSMVQNIFQLFSKLNFENLFYSIRLHLEKSIHITLNLNMMLELHS